MSCPYEIFHVSADTFLASFDSQDGTWFANDMEDNLPPKRRRTREDIVACAESLAGWYYWFCFPGCIPDSDAFGPYGTAEKAEESAKEDSEDE